MLTVREVKATSYSPADAGVTFKFICPKCKEVLELHEKKVTCSCGYFWRIHLDAYGIKEK